MINRRLFMLGAMTCAPLGLARASMDRESLALEQSVRLADSFTDSAEARAWLKKMSRRLRYQIRNPYYRIELLRLIHREASRVKLAPELVMGVIQVESSFNRFAVSEVGARGLMQVMPFWIKEIGHPGDDLFNPAINLRYGCQVLKNYLRQTRGELDRALSLYHGSMASTLYASRVRSAMNRFIVG